MIPAHVRHEIAEEGAAGNEPARRFDERMDWCHSRKILKRVAGERGQVEVPFWRMTKVLASTALPDEIHASLWRMPSIAASARDGNRPLISGGSVHGYAVRLNFSAMPSNVENTGSTA